MVDLFGTPYTKSLHVVERYRLRDYDDVEDAIERNKTRIGWWSVMSSAATVASSFSCI
jgi:hypothetical protein